MKIHFVGINGSGISGVACITKTRGYDVDGCDGKVVGDYTKQLEELNIKIYEGHSKEHLDGADIVVLSPALLFKDKWKSIDELVVANKKGIPVIKWQKFLGDYIMKGQNVVSVCGTHGKTTTTTLTALMFENGGFDPTCMVGGEIKEWKQNYRVGKSNWYILESDEYDRNFIDYHPKYIILNNLEMEHPECFKDLSDYINAFKDFLKTIQNEGKIVFPYYDKNVLKLILELKDELLNKKVELVGYGFKRVKVKDGIKYYNINSSVQGQLTIARNKFIYSVLGQHNIQNICASSIMSLECGIKIDAIKDIVKNFNGSKRRLDMIFENDRVKLYDDYAHHHTQVQTTIQALKDDLKNGEKIIAILEPHLVSRILQNTQEYKDFMHLADYPIITKIFKSREADLPDPDVKAVINDASIEYIELFDDVVERVKNIIEKDNSKFRILVMGAGYSYKLAEQLKTDLTNKTL